MGSFERYKVCVFISHKKEDQDIAIELGKYLTEQLDVDIYLDLFDSELREAVSVENDAKIVASVINGPKLSQILLCIISDKTRLSWWVPYEIGMADNAGIKIAPIKTKNIDDFPSFLKTKTMLNNLTELTEFILKNGNMVQLFVQINIETVSCKELLAVLICILSRNSTVH